MCYFLAIQLQTDVSETDLKLPEHMWLKTDKFVDLIPIDANCVVRFITNGMCSCDIVGAGNHRKDLEFEKRMIKYEHLGWSTAKRNRAIAEHALSSSRKQSSSSSALFRNWLLDYLRRDADVALFVHWTDDELPKTGKPIFVKYSDIQNLSLEALKDNWIKFES
jgi:hypothetical protein